MRKYPKYSQSFSGFTLIEVMMAGMILVVGFIGVIQAITASSEMLDTARKQQVATQIVEDEIERLRASAWSDIVNLPSTGTITIGYDGNITGDATCFALCNYTAATTDDNVNLAQLAKGFSCTVTKSFLRPSAASISTVTFLRMDYLVSWTSNTGRPYTRSTQAFFGKNGLHLSYQKS